MRIDLKKSIDKRRVIEVDRNSDSKVELVMSWIVGILFTLMLFGISIFIIYNSLTKQTDYPFYFLLTLIIVGTISLCGLIFRDRLFKLNMTSDLQTNKTLLKEILKEVYPKNTFIDTGNVWTSKRLYKFMGESSFNRVTVIYHNSDVYINAEFFGRGLFQSPLHLILYLLKFNDLRSKIQEKISRTSYKQRVG
jgi:uncharacterized integral membrane protein